MCTGLQKLVMEKAISPFQKALLDPRWLQLFLLANFLIYGWTFLDWDARAAIYSAALISCLGTQFVWSRIKGLPRGSWKSALISALGLCLLLRVNTWEVMMLAGMITISSKFIFRFRAKHIFNPTNFGIIAIILFGMGWISPGQWGSGEVVFGLVLTGAALVLFGIDRWDVALSFLLALFILEGRNVN